MTGLDTNILIRYLVQDDPIQSPKATAIFERLTEANPGFVSIVAIAETAWVLERAYNLEDHEIAGAIERMLQADALIGVLGAKAGCRSTLTFDRKACRLPGFAPA